MSPEAVHQHPAALAHQFDNLEQQQEVAMLGMWVFLATEILFFGGLFVTYLVYRHWYPRPSPLEAANCSSGLARRTPPFSSPAV